MQQKEVIFIDLPSNQNLQQLIAQLEGIQWSGTQGYWYMPYTFEFMESLTFHMNGKAFIKVVDLPLNNFKPTIDQSMNENVTEKQNETVVLKPESIIEINRFRKWLESKQYSENTIHTYIGALVVFLKYLNHKEIKDIDLDDVTGFNQVYLLDRKRSASYQNQTINAIKLFFKITYQTKLDVSLIKRPKRPRKLPNVLKKEDIKLLLESTVNLKHKTMIALIYSCGLRTSEMLNLNQNHIKKSENILKIVDPKTTFERNVPISAKTIELIEHYQKIYEPKTFLFEGRKEGERYDERSLQNAFKLAVTRSGMNSEITLHWLRHSYATHLLETGVDLQFIQEILGHKSKRTTELYIHLRKQHISHILSPFDQL